MTHDPDTVERDNAAIAYDAVVSTPRNEPSAFKRQCFRDGWDAALSAMPAQGVKVKPLEWVEQTPRYWFAKDPLGDSLSFYRAHPFEDGYKSYFQDFRTGAVASSDFAKAAADAHHEIRILSALDLPTPPVSKGD